MVTILADDEKYEIGSKLHQAFLQKGIETEYIPLQDVHVKPCVNCGGCTYKTYSKCIIRDDCDWILPKIIHTDVLLFVSPLLFGGFALRAKRIIDKLSLIMDRRYCVKKGELTKYGKLHKQFRYYALGVMEAYDADTVEAFQKLVHETVVITRGKGKAYVTGPALSDLTVQDIAGEVTSA